MFYIDIVTTYIYGGEVNICKTKLRNFVEALKSFGMKTNSLEDEIDEKLKIGERLQNKEMSKLAGKHNSDDVPKQLTEDDDINNEGHEREKDSTYNCPECPYFSHKESKVLKHKEVNVIINAQANII